MSELSVVESHIPIEAPESFHAVAINATEMREANAKIESFLVAKCAEVDLELSEMQKACDVAVTRKWASATLKNQVRSITRRKIYYDKLLTAVQAGYTIVPNMDCSIFAVRTNRKLPTMQYNYGESAGSFMSASPVVPDEKPQELPVGVGEYQNPEPAFSESREKVNRDGKDIYTVEQFGEGWQDIVFPLAAAHSEVMKATASSMQRLIFDRIGIVPQTRRALRGDPLIVGQIVRKVGCSEKVTTFLIGWHLDVRTL